MICLRFIRVSAAAFAAGAMLWAGSALCEGAPDYGGIQRLCQPQDLAGHVFLMVDFRETPARNESRWFHHFRYAYLSFGRNNFYTDLASNRPLKTAAQFQKILRSTKGGQYILSKEGVLSLIKGDLIRYTYRCVSVLKPYDEYVKNDIILTGYTRKKKSELYKLYRLWY